MSIVLREIEMRARALECEIQEDADQPGKWLWFDPQRSEGSDISFDTAQEALENLLLTRGESDACTLQLNLVVDYDLHGESAQTMRQRLERAIEHALGNGLLTGETGAEVSRHSFDVKVTSWSGKPDLDESYIVDFLYDRIENGQMNLEDLPVRMARYGLMSSGEFLEEMHDQMQAVEFGPYSENDSDGQTHLPIA